MSKTAGHELTPEEEAFYKRHPELGKAMEEMQDEEAWRRLKEHRLKAEMHRKEVRRIIDKWQRELGI